MKQPLKGQALLLQGWHQNLDAYNCLNNYFVNIENTELLLNEIRRFYANELDKSKQETFLQVIKIEFHKHQSLQVPLREIAYEIVADCIETQPNIASELLSFNPKDKSLTKDIMKFKASKMRKP